MTASILPADLGLPAKFKTWRPGQWQNIETTLNTDKRFIAASTPTGGGKSLYAVASAILEAKRAVYLTSTKGLQEQLKDDFSSCGMFDMRGRQNYRCVKGSISCAEGRILECRDSSCPYQVDRSQFLDSKLTSTNYAYYLSSVIHSEGVGDTGMLIMDEAHASIQELCNAIEIRLEHNKSNHIYQNLNSVPPFGKGISEWRTWAAWLLPKAQRMLKDVKSGGQYKWLSVLDNFVLTVARIAAVSDEWILDESNSSETLISPLWPTEYADRYLFQSIPRIILASATLVPKTLSLLGIKEEDSIFLSQDHTFDPNRCPLYLFGPVRVDSKTTPAGWAEVFGRMDSLISKRLDRKGIIHTTSYANQEKVLHASDYRDIMIAPRKASEFQAAIEEFRAADPPRILVSPSATTGYDFPFDQCEFQILLKVPFLDTRSPVMNARQKADKEYFPYLTAQTLVQTVGRAMRAPDDRCECVDPATKILTDDLHWVEAHSLGEGDHLLAFEENAKTKNRHRRWIRSRVQACETRDDMFRVRVTYEDGSIICTPNHPFLVHSDPRKWVRADQLEIGMPLIRLCTPWEFQSSYDSGWLAGIFDGEGCLSTGLQTKPEQAFTTLSVAQKQGVILDGIVASLTANGFDYRMHKRKQNAVVSVTVGGGFSEIMRFLGQTRPERLIQKFISKMPVQAIRAVAYPKIISVEDLEPGPITVLQTSSRTFVAEGMAVHNSFLMDDHARWFLKKHRDLIPSWFMRQIRYPDGQPQPPPPLSVTRKAVQI